MTTMATMFRDTNEAQISRSENPYSHMNLRKKRVGSVSQFTQDKDDGNLGKRRKIRGEHNLVDRISEFPDEILVSILSLLPLKEAASTSILSRRWRYVWASTMTLNFDDVNFVAGDTFNRFLELNRALRDQQSYRYADWVNRVVEQHRGQTIEQFSACFFLDYRFKNSIDKWIQFAMEKKVQILELEFPGEENGNDDYTFPYKLLGISIKKGSALEQFLYSAWENLQSDIPSLHSCGNGVGFKSLKVLRLRHVGVNDEVLEYLLSNCPDLERLSLNAARGLIKLRVVGPSIALKHLVIKHCHDLKTIEICDANIVSFNYSGYGMTKTNLLLSNVPSLVEVSFSRIDSTRLLFTKLSSCLSQLEFLELDIRGADYNQNDVFPRLEKLKHLELVVAADYDRPLHHLTSFLRASPYLQKLVLKLEMSRSREIGELEKAAKCPHHYLKAVEIAGYRARTCAFEHVMYLIENVAALEKIVIDPVRSWRWPSGMDRPLKEVEEEIRGRDHALRILRKKVPSSIDFVCLSRFCA